MKYISIFEKFYSPPLEVKERLNKAVSELLNKYEGGRPFFHALDGFIKDMTNEDIILALLQGTSNEYICASGEFGDKIYKLWKDGKFKCKGVLVFNGKMRTSQIGIKSYYPSNFLIKDKKFVYVDDSYFTGSTANKINRYLIENGSKIKSVSVVYDGCKKKRRGVNSFFRYYNI
jgi:hypothetical protein